ncbi:MAG: hypothetical protein OHK93_007253 [Ramalina farinacea]|uniref:Uncharacterized protein n=1 Tax=Ramalina farinacea TaxID=258253 RepID=A0AA43TU77_9LECA|nr:hypothetical protein [Ramalina farinacea]
MARRELVEGGLDKAPLTKGLCIFREHWKSGEENKQRGQAWLDTIYKENRAGAIKSMEAHKDFFWISQNITYGLYLSDHSILDGIETEIVVLSGIMMQNLARETGWHLRGTRRVGVSKEDTETIQQCVSLCSFIPLLGG